MADPLHLHASAVVIDGKGVIISGPSGAGKSDLALRLIDRGAQLLGDDALYAEADDGHLIIRPAPLLGGKLEVRGVGIVELEYRAEAPAAIWVEVDRETQRLPDGSAQREIGGIIIPMLRLNPFAASAAIKVELALRQFSAKTAE